MLRKSLVADVRAKSGQHFDDIQQIQKQEEQGIEIHPELSRKSYAHTKPMDAWDTADGTEDQASRRRRCSHIRKWAQQCGHCLRVQATVFKKPPTGTQSIQQCTLRYITRCTAWGAQTPSGAAVWS